MALFELARVYLPSGEPRTAEHWHLGGIAEGGFSRAKGVLETLYGALHVDLRVQPAQRPQLHPGKAARFDAGWVGELHPSLLEGEWGAFELDLAALFSEVPERLVYDDVITFPALHQDLAFVVDDGSTDETAAIGRERGAEVVSFPQNRGLPAAVAAGYEYAARRHYGFCGRVDADGQHPPAELRRLLERVRSGKCDVAVGSRFASGEGFRPYRYRPSPARRFGTALLRRTLTVRLGRPFADATSGMYAVNAKAFPLLAQPYTTGAPEVQGLLRLADAGLV